MAKITDLQIYICKYLAYIFGNHVTHLATKFCKYLAGSRLLESPNYDVYWTYACVNYKSKLMQSSFITAGKWYLKYLTVNVLCLYNEWYDVKDIFMWLNAVRFIFFFFCLLFALVFSACCIWTFSKLFKFISFLLYKYGCKRQIIVMCKLKKIEY